MSSGSASIPPENASTVAPKKEENDFQDLAKDIKKHLLKIVASVLAIISVLLSTFAAKLANDAHEKAGKTEEKSTKALTVADECRVNLQQNTQKIANVIQSFHQLAVDNRLRIRNDSSLSYSPTYTAVDTPPSVPTNYSLPSVAIYTMPPQSNPGIDPGIAAVTTNALQTAQSLVQQQSGSVDSQLIELSKNAKDLRSISDQLKQAKGKLEESQTQLQNDRQNLDSDKTVLDHEKTELEHKKTDLNDEKTSLDEKLSRIVKLNGQGYPKSIIVDNKQQQINLEEIDISDGNIRHYRLTLMPQTIKNGSIKMVIDAYQDEKPLVQSQQVLLAGSKNYTLSGTPFNFNLINANKPLFGTGRAIVNISLAH